MTSINKRTIQRRFGKHANSYKEHATVQREICNAMVHVLLQQKFVPAQVLELGCGVGFLTEDFLRNFKVQSYIANDIAPEMETEMQQIAEKTRQNLQFLSGDAETIAFNNMFDTVLSTSTLQWFHNVPQFFQKIQENLLPQGIFAFSTFGTENFREITTCAGKSLHYYSAEELCAMLAGDFHILHCESYCKQLFFATPTDALCHIKQTGVNNFIAEWWTKTRLQNFTKAYYEQFSTSQGVTLTYNPIIIVAQKKNQ